MSCQLTRHPPPRLRFAVLAGFNIGAFGAYLLLFLSYLEMKLAADCVTRGVGKALSGLRSKVSRDTAPAHKHCPSAMW